MRLIDADALTSWLYSMGGCDAQEPYFQGWDTAIGEVQDYVDCMPTVPAAPSWIPVTERLPDTDCKVLIADTDGYVGCTLFWQEIGRFGRWEITHWMPLPAPPEGET